MCIRCRFLSFFFYNMRRVIFLSFFFFNDTATTEIYTLSLHDALPIWLLEHGSDGYTVTLLHIFPLNVYIDRKSTRLNSSHLVISYAVFCLKKKKSNSYMNILCLRTDYGLCSLSGRCIYN